MYFAFAGFSASRKVKLVIKIYSLYSTENRLAIALVVSRLQGGSLHGRRRLVHKHLPTILRVIMKL